MAEPKIAITMGDAAGIGPEIIMKSLPRFEGQQLIVVGARGVFEKTKKQLGLDLDMDPYLLDLIPDFDFEFGSAQNTSGNASFKALQSAIDLLKKEEISGLVTAPISKEAWWRSGNRFPGHTEILAGAFNVENFAMLAYSEPIKVAFVTTHTPLGEVARLITPWKVFDTILLLDDFLKRIVHMHNPQIAVLAFNPHSFEFSRGEEENIEQAIDMARDSGAIVDGPFPADTIGALVGDYAGFVAMYHDQGMIPAKLLSQGSGVNVTLGLPFVRTSPLHGTAFDIAGKGVASSLSMETAIACALKWTKFGVGKT